LPTPASRTHAMPLLETVPMPVPAVVTVKAKRAKVALTALAALMVTWQLGLEVTQAPVKPTKPKPGAGVAVSVTTLLSA